MKAKWGDYPADSYRLKNITVSYGYWSGTDMPSSLPRSPFDHSVIALDRVRAARGQQRRTVASGNINMGRAESVIDFSRAKFGLLSGRQRDVLALLVQGRSNKEIARTLGLAEGTVKIHVTALFTKLGIHRRAAVAVAAWQMFGDNEVLGQTA